MKSRMLNASVWLLLSPCIFAESGNTGMTQLQTEISQLKQDYEQRLQALEQQNNTKIDTSKNAFNPALSVILDGRFTAYNNNPEDYELPGFALGGEAGLIPEGLSIGHTEIVASANVDDRFYGQLTIALAEHDGETEVELEEAFMESLSLGDGLTLRGGRFFSALGYINQQHNHAWDFADAPLVYAGLWGNKYIDDGARLSWIAPADIFVEIGAEVFAGGHFPAGGERNSGVGSNTRFINIGSDINDSHSWQSGLSYYTAEVLNREAGGHDHGSGSEETPSFSGDSDVYGASFIYKWAPNGNYKNRHFKLQAEYFSRKEQGDIEMVNSDPLESTNYTGKQNGFYVQGIYQFMPQWRTGLRYDQLSSSADGSDADVLEEASLDNEGIKPKRYSVMTEWLPSEFSRVRLQYNHDKSYEHGDHQIILQYTMSLGAHGAHSY
jgi:hypothetical protein